MDFRRFTLFLFDMDGTLWLGDRLYPFTKELLATIRAQGKRYLYMTNNSSRSPLDHMKKLHRLGITDATEADFITSSQVTATYLATHFPNKKLYVGGTESFKAELRRAGLCVTDTYADDVDAVVMGFDTELTFQKLEDMSRLLTRDIPYIATNPDYVCPTEFGSVPDCGSVADMLYNATGKRPFFVGKPSPLMVETAMRQYGVPAEQTIVVGDRCYTDIACGVRAGVTSLLVMSGETTPEILAASEVKPTCVMADCGELLAAIR